MIYISLNEYCLIKRPTPQKKYNIHKCAYGFEQPSCNATMVSVYCAAPIVSTSRSDQLAKTYSLLPPICRAADPGTVCRATDPGTVCRVADPDQTFPVLKVIRKFFFKTITKVLDGISGITKNIIFFPFEGL